MDLISSVSNPKPMKKFQFFFSPKLKPNKLLKKKHGLESVDVSGDRHHVLALSTRESHLQHLPLLRDSLVLLERSQHPHQRADQHYLARSARKASPGPEETPPLRTQTRPDRA